jgi:hypothetical protein
VRIGRERLRQILHERGISFQRTRTWKESRDPDRDAKLDRIEYVTSHYPDRCFAFDQFGPLSIRPCHGTCWAPRKHPARLRATYHRTHGIRYFHGCYSLGDDQLWGVTREHKGGDHTLAALKSIRAARPGGYRLPSRPRRAGSWRCRRRRTLSGCSSSMTRTGSWWTCSAGAHEGGFALQLVTVPLARDVPGGPA